MITQRLEFLGILTLALFSFAAICVGQPPVPVEDPSAESDEVESDSALQPIPADESADAASEGDCNCQSDCNCGGTGICRGCGGRCRAAIGALTDPAARAERRHLIYLKSVQPGHKMYTHQWNQYHAQQRPWHGGYYHRDWGKPLAMVVPPTANYQTHWGWGVGMTTTTPIYHQFSRPFPSAYGYEQTEGMPEYRFRRAPNWPSHTDQYGAHYIRGPW